MNLANFMKVQLYASMETLKYGMEIMKEEKVAIDRVYGHGGLFKTPEVAQRALAAAIHAPVTVMETAGEGGAWGMAILAAYMMKKNGKSLPDFLDENVFGGMEVKTLAPTESGKAGFAMQPFCAR
jgi:sugar (pentulose or hexulose) kinase